MEFINGPGPLGTGVPGARGPGLPGPGAPGAKNLLTGCGVGTGPRARKGGWADNLLI